MKGGGGGQHGDKVSKVVLDAGIVVEGGQAEQTGIATPFLISDPRETVWVIDALIPSLFPPLDRLALGSFPLTLPPLGTCLFHGSLLASLNVSHNICILYPAGRSSRPYPGLCRSARLPILIVFDPDSYSSALGCRAKSWMRVTSPHPWVLPAADHSASWHPLFMRWYAPRFGMAAWCVFPFQHPEVFLDSSSLSRQRQVICVLQNPAKQRETNAVWP